MCINVTLFESCGKYYNSATCIQNSGEPFGWCGYLLCKPIFLNGWVCVHSQCRHSSSTAMVEVGLVAYCPNLAKNHPWFLRRNLRISSTTKISSTRIGFKLVYSSKSCTYCTLGKNSWVNFTIVVSWPSDARSKIQEHHANGNLISLCVMFFLFCSFGFRRWYHNSKIEGLSNIEVLI